MDIEASVEKKIGGDGKDYINKKPVVYALAAP